MGMLKDSCKKGSTSKRIILFICLITTIIIWTGCHRKMGVKPGGQLKPKTAKCKCKKRSGGILSEVYKQESVLYYFEHSRVNV